MTELCDPARQRTEWFRSGWDDRTGLVIPRGRAGRRRVDVRSDLKSLLDAGRRAGAPSTPRSAGGFSLGGGQGVNTSSPSCASRSRRCTGAARWPTAETPRGGVHGRPCKRRVRFDSCGLLPGGVVRCREQRAGACRRDWQGDARRRVPTSLAAAGGSPTV
jgi:hypothetical protein